MSFGAADFVDACEFLGEGLGPEVAGTGGVDIAERTALLAGAIVGSNEDDRIRQHACLLEETDEARQVPIGMVEHGRIGRLQAGEETPFVGAVVLPGLHAVVPWRQARRWRHDARRLLALDPEKTLGIPAVLENRIVALDELEGRLMRRMARPEREPQEPWRVGLLCRVPGQEGSRLIDEVSGQVGAAFEGPRSID